MKKEILKLILCIHVFNTFSQTHTWEAIVNNGFGDNCNLGIIEFEEYDGYLYAGTMLSNSANCSSAELWRSISGETGTWEQITDFTPALETRGIPSFGKTEMDSGIFWLGLTSPDKGALIYRSVDGKKWEAISKRGFGNKAMTVPAPHMVVFQGSNDSIPFLYAGMGSHGGNTNAQVWRTPYNNIDSLAWELLMDFKNIDANVTIISYFYVWNNKLYFSTDGWAQLWESTDGRNFQMNQSVQYGFGVSTNYVLSSMVEYKGFLYITTTNMQGGQLWKSADGIQWDSITLNAFGKADSVTELRSLRVFNDEIWLTSYTNKQISKGNAVWYSEDGSNFVQSNIDGFGDNTNNGPNAVVYGQGNYMYYGGPNYNDGAQLWRTLVIDTTGTSLSSMSENISTLNKSVKSIKELFDKYGNDTKEVQLVDVLNRTLYSGRFEDTLIYNYIHDLKPGIYFLQMQTIQKQLIAFKFRKL